MGLFYLKHKKDEATFNLKKNLCDILWRLNELPTIAKQVKKVVCSVTRINKHWELYVHIFGQARFSFNAFVIVNLVINL